MFYLRDCAKGEEPSIVLPTVDLVDLFRLLGRDVGFDADRAMRSQTADVVESQPATKGEGQCLKHAAQVDAPRGESRSVDIDANLLARLVARILLHIDELSGSAQSLGQPIGKRSGFGWFRCADR